VLFYSDPETNRSARVIVRAFAKNPALEFEVLLDPIPASGGGQEVTANFFAYNLDNNNTFYTDSNALEMQQRILNQRPTFTLQTDEPIAANYYPINSAIVINDEKQGLSFVVTNDRSQGGSVIENARVEFMHNRRLFEDDHRGVDEPLSENGTFGVGIQIQATYTVHFVIKSVSYSK
jgi:lysosomal alpha-mannosidase